MVLVCVIKVEWASPGIPFRAVQYGITGCDDLLFASCATPLSAKEKDMYGTVTYQYCRKLVAITSSSSNSSSLCATFLLARLALERFDNGAGLEGRACAGSGLFE